MDDLIKEKLTRRSFLGRSTLVGVGLVSGLLWACGGSEGNGEGGQPSDESPSGEAPTSEGAVEQSGGTLIYAQNQPINLSDPINPQTYPAAYESNYTIHSNLVTFDPDLEIVGDLAESWEVSDDNLTWTFALRQGVKFHDGTPFNAEAVAEHVERIQNPDNASPNKNLWDHIAEVTVVDDHTVELVTAEPFGPMLNYLAHGSGGIESPAAVQEAGQEYGHHPIGTGPYKVERMTPGTEIELVGNDDYFGGTPKLDAIIMRSVPEVGSRVAMIEAGQATVANDIPPEEAERLGQGDQIQIIRQKGLRTFYLEFNLNREIFQDVKVRQALNQAVDKQAIVESLFLGYGEVLTSPAASSIQGHAQVGEYPYDPERAAQLLAEAGWQPGEGGILQKDGLRMEFTINTAEGEYPKDIQVAETIQANLQDVGCDVSIWKVEAAGRWSYLRVPPSEAQYDTVLFGFNPSNGDLGYHLNSLFHSNPDPNKAPYVWNLMWYSNEEVDRLIEEAQATADVDVRFERLGQAQQLVWDDAPVIWLYAPDILVAAQKDVQGLYIWPTIFTVVREASIG